MKKKLTKNLPGCKKKSKWKKKSKTRQKGEKMEKTNLRYKMEQNRTKPKKPKKIMKKKKSSGPKPAQTDPSQPI